MAPSPRQLVEGFSALNSLAWAVKTADCINLGSWSTYKAGARRRCVEAVIPHDDPHHPVWNSALQLS